ncbi:hypothetical protein F5883DRAFT_524212 [Diaporthe sp. PMI_573]|nr:hypothetical protein F5883DRAFT_524212 [Diaporthaceae sp. PMI_573]
MRQSYKDGIFGHNAYRHLAALYELEAFLLKGWEPQVNHVLAGMNHFAHYLQHVVYITQTCIKIGASASTTKTDMQLPRDVKLKRLIIFLVKDVVEDHYVLCWFDHKTSKLLMIDSHHSGYEAMSNEKVARLGSALKTILNRAGLNVPTIMTRLGTTAQLSEMGGSATDSKKHVSVLSNLFRGFFTQSALNGGIFIEVGDYGCCGVLMLPGATLENPWTMIQAGLIPALWNPGVGPFIVRLSFLKGLVASVTSPTDSAIATKRRRTRSTARLE